MAPLVVGSSLRVRSEGMPGYLHVPTYHKGGSVESDMCDMSAGGTVGFDDIA